MTGHWRPMRAANLAAVERIAEIVHPAYPESEEVPAERLTLFPAGCLIAEGALAKNLFAGGTPFGLMVGMQL